jgi:tetratricopeptide (TPR) repeat protein
MIALLLLLAAPERVVVIARPAEKPGFFQKLGKALSGAAHRLYEKPDPDVDQGNALAMQNDPEGALEAYDRALERLPHSPELHLNRANQMLKLGSDHAMRAHDESKKAMETGDRSLKARAAFDLALSDEELGNPDEAIKAYEQTLALDPDDRDAKVNLELLLKSKEERKQKQPQQQPQSQQNKQDQQQQQPDKNKGEQQQQQQQQKEAGDKKEEQKEQPQQAKQQDKQQQQQAEDKPVDRSEAERLLDALRAGEKNLQVWRFAKDKHKEARRGEVEKDW